MRKVVLCRKTRPDCLFTEQSEIRPTSHNVGLLLSRSASMLFDLRSKYQSHMLIILRRPIDYIG